ncbi:MAG: GntR family transcriptional regulator [Bacillota bacterium]|nr:GntR family transcriptional regulator [Bacillota bacterium]NLJ02562.1 GntR family transcriptional regulator [Bacillota bacterium]
MNIDFSTSIPIYLQIIEEFKRQIVTGELKPGDKIPSQRDLAAQIRVNANTVQRAYREMELMGLVETLRGQGTFVSQNQGLVEETRIGMLTNLVDDFVRAVQALGLSQDAALELVKSRFSELEAREEVNDK